MTKPEYKSPKAECVYCHQDFTKQGMKPHLVACEARQKALAGEPEKETVYHIRTQGAYAPDYWMHFEIAGQRTLKDLDTFLRNIWLECCGHLSAFEIDSRQYSVHESGAMSKKLSAVLSSESDFVHEYDFGDSTILMLQVVEVRQGYIGDKKKWRILARNHPPEIFCDVCEERKASQLCTQCRWDESADSLLCDTCVELHECDESLLLPLVNSPRAGQCGFTGAPLT